jgi:hypothetical protein
MKKQLTGVALAFGLAMVPSVALADIGTTTLSGVYGPNYGTYRQMNLGTGTTTWTFTSWPFDGYLQFYCNQSTPVYQFFVPAGTTTYTTDVIAQGSCYYVTARTTGGAGTFNASFTFTVYGT